MHTQTVRFRGRTGAADGHGRAAVPAAQAVAGCSGSIGARTASPAALLPVAPFSHPNTTGPTYPATEETVFHSAMPPGRASDGRLMTTAAVRGPPAPQRDTAQHSATNAGTAAAGPCMHCAPPLHALLHDAPGR